MKNNSKKPIGIFGGTFDPIHSGHVHVVSEIYRLLQLQEIRIIPCYQTVHREQPQASPADRLAMVKLAVQKCKGVTVDDREIRREGPSYTIDTLTSIRQESDETPLCLIMATDAFAGFHHWKRWQDILTFAHLIVVKRPNHSQPIAKELVQLLNEHQITNPEPLFKKNAGSIYVMDFSYLPISATEVREKIAKGENPQDLLPDTVWQYIQKHGLYQKTGK